MTLQVPWAYGALAKKSENLENFSHARPWLADPRGLAQAILPIAGLSSGVANAKQLSRRQCKQNAASCQLAAFGGAYLIAQELLSLTRESSNVQTSSLLPRPSTWASLERSRNLAAVTSLSSGLASSSSALRQRCLQSLLAREEEAAKRAIMIHWERYDDCNLELLRAQPRHFVAISLELLLSGSLSEKRAALKAIGDLDLTENIAAVTELALQERHALHTQAMQCLQAMCDHWGRLARCDKDVPSIRTPMLECLSQQLALFHEHKNTQIVDAWLCLTHWDDSLQRGIVSDPGQVAYRCVLERLAHSQNPAVLQLLAGYLLRSTTPKSILDIILARSESEFAIEIARLLDNDTLPIALKHLRQSTPLVCLQHLDMQRPDIDFETRKILWLMVAASQDDLSRVLGGAIALSAVGTADARQVAADMLRSCRRPDIERLVPTLQASAMGYDQQSQNLSQYVHTIVAWLDSPWANLRSAAHEFLQDFSLENLMNQVRYWPTQMCKAMAGIVAKTDPDVAQNLSRELQSPAPKRRMAALQVTEILNCGEQVSRWLMPLLDDPRLDVRVRVIDVLSALGHEALEPHLPDLLEDASTDIQDAANRALRRLSRQPSPASSPILELSLDRGEPS